jgi:glycosyltransferase involved in cell wall biosynthesis
MEFYLGMKISLLVTTYNDPFRLEKTLLHLLRQKPQPLEILVCDDGSTPETKVLVDRFAAISETPIRHLFQTNDGWNAPGVRNLGAMTARGDYLLMTDGDCVPHPGFMRDHHAAAEQGCFVVGERSHVLKDYVPGFSTRPDVRLYFICTKKIQKRSSAFRNPFEKPAFYLRENIANLQQLTSMVMACNFGVWKRDFIAVNGFDESFRAWWPEDAECAARLLNCGIKLKKFQKKCLVYHLNHGKTARACHEECSFAEQVLVSGTKSTGNGIEQRAARLFQSKD